MGFLEFGMGALAVWRVTHLLHAEDGPWDLLVRLRRGAGQSVAGRMMDCFYCASVWMALPFAVAMGQGWREMLLAWPALSGAAILLERMMERQEKASWIFEEGEKT